MGKNKIEFINNGVSSDIDKIMADKTVKKVAIMIEREDAPEKKPWRKPDLPDFFFCFGEFSFAIMKAKLKGETMRLLWLLLSIMDFNNKVDIDIKFLHEELECSRKTVYNGIEELKGKGIIIKVNNLTGKDYYAINADGFWRGSKKERKDFLKDNGEMPKLLIAPKDV